MKILLNTSFFFSPTVADEVRRQLKSFWLPACRAAAEGEPMTLKMPAEEGIMRLAVQSVFGSASEARKFRDEVLGPETDRMTRRLGAEAFTAFTTMMEIIEL